LVEVAQTEACAVSAVQATRENLLPYFGVVGGKRVPGRQDLYIVETVVEKPSPTEAELRLIVPGLRAGHYLCFWDASHAGSDDILANTWQRLRRRRVTLSTH
jgi:UTP--glucose-1-phosphate uridylyltransferase